MSKHVTALSAASLLALAACTDAADPTGLRPDDAGPRRDVFTGEAGLLRAAEARVNQSEPAQWDRTRFNIALAFQVEPTARQREVFELAAARWERVIINDVPSISGTLPSCTGGAPVTTTGVDDIVIQVQLVPIDGPGRVLGSAGPCFVRNGDNLPVSGLMRFDVADLATLEARGLFDEVIVHEMGHVLGIGTLWNFRRALRVGSAPSPSVYFAGQYANTHWNAEGGTAQLPIENTGGAGTANGHWRESVLRNELMTGFLNLGENPLSRISAASLRDLGYGVAIVGEQYALLRGTAGVAPGAGSREAAAQGATIAEDGVHIDLGEELLSAVGYVPTANEP